MATPTEPPGQALRVISFPSIAGSSPPSPVNPLVMLLNDVVTARATLAQQRRIHQITLQPNGPARAAMLSALEAYTAALGVRRLPVPYALRDELRLHQRVRP
jgi:hypothetical protein